MKQSAVIVWTVSDRVLTGRAWTQSQVSPRGICGGQNGTVVGLSQCTSVFLCQYHSIIAPYSFLIYNIVTASSLPMKMQLNAALPLNRIYVSNILSKI
jgi:hypothetical protein